MKELRIELPKKTFTGVKFTTNITNKKHLAKDFQHRCAYCDDLDNYMGGERNYHLEHFAPKSLFPELEYNYDNLLYSCPFCNLSKSNKWPSKHAGISIVGNTGFINPCNTHYYEHIKRNETGELIYIGELGKYMYENLSLGLLRHKYLYLLDQLKCRIDLLELYKSELNSNSEIYIKIDNLLCQSYELFYYYFKVIYF